MIEGYTWMLDDNYGFESRKLWRVNAVQLTKPITLQQAEEILNIFTSKGIRAEYSRDFNTLIIFKEIIVEIVVQEKEVQACH
jgi:UDP-3-O-acyl-N-acetylglucosamine deacetylase